MGRNSKRPQGSQGSSTPQNANELLNFRFSTSAASRQDHSHPTNNRSGSSNHSHHYHGGGQGDRNHHSNRRGGRQRSAQDRASARRKANASMFYLHSSAEHAFLLTRRASSRINNVSNLQTESTSSSSSSSYSFDGSDHSVSWDAVRMVKQLVPLGNLIVKQGCGGRNDDADDELTCPICLCGFVCPRITKCGHSFCSSCILRHVQTYAASNPYHDVKCPCCGLPVIVQDMRPVFFERVIAPMVAPAGKAGRYIRLRKLHRQRQCSAPYLPVPDAPMHSNPHAAPASSDEDAKYCRFNYVDPDFYHASLVADQGQLERELGSLPPPSLGGVNSYTNDLERIYLSMALEQVLEQQQQAQQELVEEQTLQQRFSQPITGMYQPQSSDLIYRVNAHHVVGTSSYELETETDGSISGPADPIDSFGEAAVQSLDGAPTTAPLSPSGHLVRQGRYRGDSIGSYTSVDSLHTPVSRQMDDYHDPDAFHISPGSNQSAVTESGGGPVRRRSPPVPRGSMYLDEASAHHFYQAEDGQLVFLNGFNMTCLLSDYDKSNTVPTQKANSDGEATLATSQETCKPPLPDFIESRILEMEHVHLTPEVRKRMPFLSHLPHYTDVIFVELDLFHILSEPTRRKFKVEFAKRRKRRTSKLQAEKRSEKAAEREEMERINERKARLQLVDPEDEFFRAPTIPKVDELPVNGEDFGPAIGGNSIPGEAGSQTTSAPAVAVPSISFSQAAQRGNSDAIAFSSAEAFPALGGSSAEAFPSLSGDLHVEKSKPAAIVTTIPISQGATGKKKKKGKGQKLVLFSTGGQRGY